MEPDWDFLVVPGEVDRDHGGLVPGIRHVAIELRDEEQSHEFMDASEVVDWPHVS